MSITGCNGDSHSPTARTVELLVRLGPADASSSYLEVTVRRREVCWNIQFQGEPKAAHLHFKQERAPDPVLVTIFEPPTEATSEGCAPEELDEVELRELVKSPEKYYVDVHYFSRSPVRAPLSRQTDERLGPFPSSPS